MKCTTVVLLVLMITPFVFGGYPSGGGNVPDPPAPPLAPGVSPDEADAIEAARKAGYTPEQIKEILEDIDRKVDTIRSLPQFAAPKVVKPKQAPPDKKKSPPEVAPPPPQEDDERPVVAPRPVAVKKPVLPVQEEKPVEAKKPYVPRPGELAQR